MTHHTPAAQDDRPLWRCPECGKQYVTARMWHSCYVGSVDDFFAGRPQRLRDTFDRYLEVARAFGPVTVDVAKTRISFQARVRFAGLRRTRKDSLVLGFWLKHRIDSARFTKVELIPPSNWVYEFVASSPDDIDTEVAEWLRAAYEVGMQRA
jgi:hypothetical protein